jgi:hypothetical protein
VAVPYRERSHAPVKQILSNYLNKTIEINYGGTTTVKGKLLEIIDGVTRLEAQDKTIFYVPIDKIHAFWVVTERDKAMGFVTKADNQD